MRIILHEIKKILNWKIALMLVIVNVILYFWFISFHIDYFPNGRPALDSYRIGVEMVEKYGTSLNEEEMMDFEKTYKERVKDADEYIQSRQDFKEAEIGSYQEFKEIDFENQAQAEVRNKVIFEEYIDIFWELQARESLLEFHDEHGMIMANEMERANTKQKEVLASISATGNYYIYPEGAFYNFQEFIKNVAIAIIISVVLVASPIFLKDRSLRLIDLQYSSRVGRNVFKKKVIAGLVSTLIVVTALLAVYFSIYSLNDTEMFFDVPINSFIGGFHWYDITFFQYIMITVAAIYILGIVFSVLAMAFSNIMPNFVALVGVQIPIVIGLIIYALSMLVNGITVLSSFPQWFVPTCHMVLVFVGTVFMFFVWRRERKLDIVQ
ncbi:ABC transporter permease [Paucisalibacillus sp. EB02]|uniref:ABC transporter permease n=1 Tax=Paucisalibacillus sp. EB02 TaxID=1347087 RepID=UPI0004BA3F1A|nr:ABC transporter permease [Paucisalibacillus sp. EB02]